MTDSNSRIRMIIKVGSEIIFHENGGINYRRIDMIASALSDLKRKGNELLLVVPGSVALGIEHEKIPPEKAEKRRYKQAAFAIGQFELMNVFAKTFAEYGLSVAQILLVKGMFTDDTIRKNIDDALETLFELRVIPIVNENSTLCTAELDSGGDNDIIAASVSSKLYADLLVIMTDKDGILTDDPSENPNAKVIHTIEKFKIPKTAYIAGLEEKVAAIEIAYESGIDVIIMNGTKREELNKFVDGEPVGTFIRAEEV